MPRKYLAMLENNAIIVKKVTNTYIEQLGTKIDDQARESEEMVDERVKNGLPNKHERLQISGLNLTVLCHDHPLMVFLRRRKQRTIMTMTLYQVSSTSSSASAPRSIATTTLTTSMICLDTHNSERGTRTAISLLEYSLHAWGIACTILLFI